MRPLNKLSRGEIAYIVDIRNAAYCAKFFELGVFPGDRVEVRENMLDNNSLLVLINNNTYNIYKKIAETIITNVVSFEVSLN